jgi:hypothetical protein
MEPADPPTRSDLIGVLGGSGFPLQTAVAVAIRDVRAPSHHGGHRLFDVHEEIAWRDRDGTDKFLDIVAIGERVRLFVECKKTKDKYVFLVSGEYEVKPDVHKLKCVYLSALQGQNKGTVCWGEGFADVPSYEARYCVVNKDAKDGKGRLLERDMQPLVNGTEAWARDRIREIQYNPNRPDLNSFMCVPVLVTTAQLFIARCHPILDVALDSGIYKAKQEHLEPVSYIRFTKEFTTTRACVANTRTVIVANATAIGEVFAWLSTVVVRDNQAVYYLWP